MAFLFGWQASDFTVSVNNQYLASHTLIKAWKPLSETGFLVTQDCSVDQVFVGISDAASTSFRVYLHDGADGSLIAVSNLVSGVDGGSFAVFPSPVPLTANQRVFFACHGETAAVRAYGGDYVGYLPHVNRNYADGPLDPFVSDGTANTRIIEIWADGSVGGSSATITNLDTDNSVTTYQQANANGVSGFGGPITSGTLGGQAVTIIDGDWETNSGVVSLRVPGSLATGSYDLVLSDGTDSATLSGVTFTQEYPYEAPYGLVDSNSDWAGQVLTEGSRWKVTTEFTNITYDYVAGSAETPPFGNDISDHAEADAEFTGTDTQMREVIYSDGTTATYTLTVTVGDGVIDVYPFSKGIKYAAAQNWEWGSRHPMTSMRVRVYK